MTEYYAHEIVTPKLRPPTVEDELQIFGPAGSLAARVADIGSAIGFQVITVDPGDDVFQRLGYAAKDAKVLVILEPGDYREITYRMPGPWRELWLYGIPGDDGVPRIQGQRPVGSPYGSPGLFMSVGAGKRMYIENLEISGFAGNAITQSAHGDLLLRNAFIHSNGGRALFRGVGCRYGRLGSTILIDSELRDANSHTVYLDYSGLSVVSGCHVSRPQKVSHCIKNISRKTLVEHNVFATGEMGQRIEDTTNAWVLVDDNAFDPREYAGSAPYDAYSGADFALVRNNLLISHESNGPWASLQTRPSTNGGHPALPAPGLGTEGFSRGELDACGDTLDPLAIGPMWTDAYWDDYQPHTQYWLDNTFEIHGSAHRMAGITIAHDHPVMWTPQGGGPLPLTDERRAWLVSKLEGRVTTRLYERGNVFPDTLPIHYSWRAGASQPYCDLVPADQVVLPMAGDVDPLAVDPLLRRWTALDLIRHYADQAPGEPIPLPSKPATVPEPEPELPVVVTPPADPVPEPVPEPEPEAPHVPYWETVGVMSEFSNASDHYRQVLQRMRRVTY